MGDIVHTIAMGLTYDGEIMHILINYALIALTVAPFYFRAHQAPAT